ncbi:MAG: alanine:cation symporter family protein, partial [Saprospiraceae bacterium]|nr:alanine:cation symporter family protein [Saprospiraceae bacterium]
TGFFIGIFLAILTGVVIIGGIKRIGSVAEKIVPFMCGIYIIAGLVVIGINYSYVPAAFGAIFEGALSAQSIAGGVIGVLIAGFRRAAFSNEAGVGSAAIAHSAVRTRYPASEGIVALLEPFIDTIIVCTMTALIIVISNTNHHFLEYGSGTGLNGVALTSAAFETTLPGFSYILALAVFLFAFSTMISWSYYGLQAWLYLFGRTKSNELSYKVIFLIFVVIGGSIQLNSVIGISDSMILAMVFPNLIGLLVLSPVVKEEVSRYLAAIKMLLGGKSDGQPNRT